MRRSEMTPEQREKARAYAREWSHNKWATDPVYRAKRMAIQQSPANREASRIRSAKRRTDPVEKAKISASNSKRRRRYRDDPVLWPRSVIHTLKKRASLEGIPFNLTADDICVPAVCPVFGVPFVFGVFNHQLSPSVDRLRPKLGYVRGNICVISRRANAMKQDAVNADEMRAVVAYMEREGLS